MRLAFVFVAVLFSSLIVFYDGAHAEDMNCTLRQSSDFVTDSYGMYDVAEDQDKCLEKCREYAKNSIDSMATSDVITKLAWTCAYDGADIHTEILVEDDGVVDGDIDEEQ